MYRLNLVIANPSPGCLRETDDKITRTFPNVARSGRELPRLGAAGWKGVLRAVEKLTRDGRRECKRVN